MTRLAEPPLGNVLIGERRRIQRELAGRIPWEAGRWRITRARVSIGGRRGWSVTFPHTVNGLPRTAWRSSHAAAIELVDQATRERWPGA